MPVVPVLILIAISIIFLFASLRPAGKIKSHWQHFFDEAQFPASELYEKIMEALAQRQITHVRVKQESFLETHILSAKRVYLRVTQGEYVYYICAAPFGTGTFVSTWLCEIDENIINRMPVINKMFGKDRNNKTFYQIDTEGMYKAAIHNAVMVAIDGMTATNGARALSDREREYK